MNILYYSPSNNLGGAELSLIEILKEAKKQNHNIYLILNGENEDKAFYKKASFFCNKVFFVQTMPWYRHHSFVGIKKIINYIYNSWLCGWYIYPTFRIARIIYKYNIDIVHTNTIMSLEASFSAKICRVPHVQHLRETIGKKKDAIVSFKYQNNFNIVSNFFGFLNSLIIANSNNTVEFAKKYF